MPYREMALDSEPADFAACTMSGFYMSECCRSELYLIAGQEIPSCAACAQPAKWTILARGGADPRLHARQSPDDLFAFDAAADGYMASNVRIVNHSPRGAAIEFPYPLALSSETEIHVEANSPPVAGVVRHCTRRGSGYLIGIEIPGGLNRPLPAVEADRGSPDAEAGHKLRVKATKR
jgi:hypothetical protein